MTKPLRAFLSHSSRDKRIVGEVAAHLGRAAVIYDVFEFEAGDDFKTSIMRGLERSEIFVLFASRDALSRDWVKLEISEAERALVSQALSRVVTYIIDPALLLEELPKWMTTTLVVRQSEPGLIALDIRRVLGERRRAMTPSYFVGRQKELEDALEKIAGFSDPAYRPPIIIYGLSGIGRRSLVRAIARDNLSYPKLLEIELKEGDLLPEFLLKITFAVSPSSVADPITYLADWSQRQPDDVIKEIILLLKTICASGALPVIVERDVISLSNGILQSHFDLLYNAIATDPMVDAAIASNRRLYGPGGAALPAVRISELSSAATQNLIRLIARDRGLVFAFTDLEQVCIYARGYPPAARFVVDEAVAYGVPYVVGNQRALVNFSAEFFLRQLLSDQKLTDGMKEVMRLLSCYSPLPLGVIGQYCRLDPETLNLDLTYPLDSAFVLPDGPNFRISEPLRDAAYRAFDGLHVQHGRIAEILDDYLTNEPDDDARLSLSQTIFRASLLSKSPRALKFAVGMASDYIQVARQCYHDKDYDLAIKYGSAAIEARPDNVDVRRYVAQALIRKERYDEAKVHISALMEAGQLKEVYYVNGFMARLRHLYPEAIVDYEKSLAYGRRGAAVRRELASCYFELGDLPKANIHIKEAESIEPHNKFIVDLRCTISIRLGDLGEAERTLNILDRVETGGFSEHRRSTFEQAKGDSRAALRYANAAIAKMTNPPFEVLSNLANCNIEAGCPNDALEVFKKLEKRFGGARHDAQAGLRCKYEIRFGDIKAAEGLWNKLRDKNTPVGSGLRIAILNRKSQAGHLTGDEEKELEKLLSLQEKTGSDRLTHLLGSLIPVSD